MLPPSGIVFVYILAATTLILGMALGWVRFLSRHWPLQLEYYRSEHILILGMGCYYNESSVGNTASGRNQCPSGTASRSCPRHHQQPFSNHGTV